MKVKRKDTRKDIKVSQKLKDQMNKFKVHPRETYEQFIKRIIEENVKLKEMKE